MTTEQVKELLFQEFKTWMFGQAYAIGKDGEPDWYETDVNRFVNKVKNAVHTKSNNRTT